MNDLPTDGIVFYNRAPWDNEAWQEESWTAHGGSEIPSEPHFHVDYQCAYVDGVHVYGGESCPHIDGLDESGLKPGWTVLNS